jgi:acetyltransferase-like isoleucine patch superfamily enzyme
MQKHFLKYGIYLQTLTVIFFFLQCSILIGIALMPSVYVGFKLKEFTAGMSELCQVAGTAFAISSGFFLYGLSIIFVIGLFRIITFSKIKEGVAPYFSIEGLKWANYNSLILTVRFTFLDFFRLTPFNIIFYRLMGAKIGRGVQINTKVMADVCLLEIGDNSVIGGDSTVICHSIEGTKLIIMPTKIGKNVTIGLMSVILPGVTIGDGAIVAAGSVVPKGTVIPGRTVWAGVPARQVKELSK